MSQLMLQADTLRTTADKAAQRNLEPKFYQVLLHNDDFTPMTFVVEVLQKFFGHHHRAAVAIMYEIHARGKGVGGTYSKDVAETKADQVMQHARHHDYPLLCSVKAQ